jgi:hypothetical protein
MIVVYWVCIISGWCWAFMTVAKKIQEVRDRW